MRIALEIYFGIVTYRFGYCFGDIQFTGDIAHDIFKILECIFYPILLIITSILFCWDWINGQTQISFFLRFYILRKSFNGEQIETLNWSLQAKTTNSLAHKVWRLCVKLANERYNKSNNGKDIKD